MSLVGLLRGTGPDLGPLMRRYPAEQRCMLRVLADRAANRSDHPWLVFDSTDVVTYRAGYETANAVGHALLERFGRGAHLGLFLRNQKEFIPAYYGALAARGVAVPLNADARGPLLEDVITRSRVRAIVARADLLDLLEELDSLGAVELVVVTGDGERPEKVHGAEVIGWDEWLADRPRTPPVDGFPGHDETALIQFTSGTSGLQKGAEYPHHFLYLYSAAVADSLGHTADDVLSTTLPFSHVAAVHIVANAALQVGATAHLKSRFSASQYWQQLADDGVTFGIMFGPMAAMVMKSCEQAPPHRVRQLFCVPPPPERVAFEERYGVKLVWQGYGMTEIYPLPMRSAANTIAGASDDTIGYPPTWMSYGVVDDFDQLLPAGEVGELVWRPLIPYAMVKGYFEEPDRTAETFRNLMFHTGDLATYDEDGLLHYLGRKHDRIRHLGENISASSWSTSPCATLRSWRPRSTASLRRSGSRTSSWT